MIKVWKFYDSKKWLKIRLFKMNEFLLWLIVLLNFFNYTEYIEQISKFWRLIKKA